MSFSPSTRQTRGAARTSLALAATLFFAVLSPLANVSRAQAFADPQDQYPTRSQSFVVYQNEAGDLTCRDATALEAQDINRDSGISLRQINHLKDSSQVGPEATSAGLTIVLQGTAQLDANPAAKQAFVNAAAKWEALVSDPITVTIKVDYGTQFFGQNYPSSNILGQTSTPGYLVPYSTIRQRLVSHASAGEEATVINNLPASGIPSDIGNLTTAFVTPAQMSALGIGQSSPPIPQIGFNSAFGFDFDPSDGVSPTLIDFDSVAVHEIGHALGFDSSVADGQNDASIWDFYRFRPGGANNSNFSTAPRIISVGSSPTDLRVEFNGGAEVPLSTGDQDGTDSVGDGNQSSHWKDDVLNRDASGVPIFIGIMDPTLARGSHKAITANDIRALDYFGYTVTQSTSAATTVQFASPIQIESETVGSAKIVITRSGSLAGASSVLFKTVDDQRPVRCDDTTTAQGVAFARCDYATTVQTITFAANETTKTVTVPLIDDSYAEPSETVTLQLSNPTGATLGSQITTTLMILSNEAAGQTGPNPLNGTDFFVRMQYLDFLSREPEVGQPWSGVLNGCAPNDTSCDRVSVSANFFRSQEFQLKGLFVFHFYKVSLGRLPTYAEMVADMSSVTGTTTADLVAKKGLFVNSWMQRADFAGAYNGMTSQQFVDTLLGRYGLTQITTPDPANPDGTTKFTLSRDILINGLNAATLTRAQVLRAVSYSDQVGAAEFNSAFVAMQYFGYLRRDPEPQGYANWLATINANPADVRSMVNGFVNSTEYRLRFGPQ